MLEYARWKYILVGTVLLVAFLFALPNVFGEDEALQLARRDREPIQTSFQQEVEQFLKSENINFNHTYIDDGRLMILFSSVPDQLRARDAVNEKFGKEHVSALSFAPRTPAWLRALGLRPMPLGLDLRGGLYLLYQVDLQSAITRLLESYEQDARRTLAQQNIPVTDVAIVNVDSDQPNAIRVRLPENADIDAARRALEKILPELQFSVVSASSGQALQGVLPPAAIRERQTYAIQQNLTTLRNRVNELGVAEPIVQRQGFDRISVQLPGVQNSAEVKDILGRVATIEFRLEYSEGNAFDVAAGRARAPIGSRLYYTREGQPVLLRREVIATGDQLTNATTMASDKGPAVSIRLDSRGGDAMFKATRANLKRNMAVVYIEKRRETSDVNGKQVTRDITDQKVISLAVIQDVLSNNFQITGLSSAEARELALLLRAGSLATPVYPVAERVVGPSLGQENIERGIQALVIGMLGLFAFMAFYYRVFGLVANAVLLANVVLLTALLSMIKTALSLPGIAGIILTVGMAVDANVLIYERIREELRNGVSPQTAIRLGFERAFSAIADSNITTLIAGVVLWIFGSGAIRGFAVVLTLGIATSMFTALMGSRALVTLMFGGKRKLASLPI